MWRFHWKLFYTSLFDTYKSSPSTCTCMKQNLNTPHFFQTAYNVHLIPSMSKESSKCSNFLFLFSQQYQCLGCTYSMHDLTWVLFLKSLCHISRLPRPFVPIPGVQPSTPQADQTAASPRSQRHPKMPSVRSGRVWGALMLLAVCGVAQIHGKSKWPKH